MGKQLYDLDKALILHRQGETYETIGQALGVSASAIFQRIRKHLPDMDRVEAMKLCKADKLLESASHTLDRINAVVKAGGQDDDDIPYKDLIAGLTALLNTHQLVTGQATSNSKQTIKHTGKIDDNVIDITSIDTPPIDIVSDSDSDND